MFSTMPSTGTPTFRNIATPLIASAKRDVLRRRDDDRPRQSDLLGERELRVAGARRHVHDQDVELSPSDVPQELLDRLHDHRPAPDDGRVLVHEEAERHEPDAEAIERQDRPSVRIELRTLVHAHHDRDRRSVDVRVHQSDRGTAAGERDREVHRDRRLSDAALPRSDGDRVGDPGKQAGIERSRTKGPAGRRGLGGQARVDRNGCDTGNRGERSRASRSIAPSTAGFPAPMSIRNETAPPSI